jgi:hypothetical protein
MWWSQENKYFVFARSYSFWCSSGLISHAGQNLVFLTNRAAVCKGSIEVLDDHITAAMLDGSHVGWQPCWMAAMLDGSHVGGQPCWRAAMLEGSHVGYFSEWKEILLFCHPTWLPLRDHSKPL